MIKCAYCKALYKSQKWVYGRYDSGTAGIFTPVGKLSEKECPVCHREQPPNKPLKSENHKNPVCNICGKDHFDFECPGMGR